jgi:hypothetical protein
MKLRLNETSFRALRNTAKNLTNEFYLSSTDPFNANHGESRPDGVNDQQSQLPDYVRNCHFNYTGQY